MGLLLRVINLDRTPERFAGFRARHPELAIQRFAAIDGRTLDRQACIDAGIITPANQYSLAAIATAMSHIALWRAAAAGEAPVHVVEDDVILRGDFATTAERALAAAPAWDIVVWGWNFDWPVQVALAPGVPSVVLQCNEVATRDQLAAFVGGTTPPVLVALASAAGTPCYSISPAGARRLLALCLPIGAERPPYVARPSVGWINAGIDTELSRHYPVCRAFAALPPLAVSPNAQDQSTIRGHLAALHDPAIANRAPETGNPPPPAV